MPRAVANDMPEWLEPYLDRVFGKGLEREMVALNAPAPIDLRVNLLKTDREAARAALAAEGVTAAPTPFSPIGLRLASARRCPVWRRSRTACSRFRTRARRSPLCWLARGPGCASSISAPGPAARRLALAAGMANRGKLVACDVSARRLERAARRLRRAGVSNVERRALASERDKWVRRHAGGFDRVFVDVPCLGTGTWRRNPDAKWRSRPEDLAELVERQQQILRSAARLVRPGGRLVYVTCSLLREEERGAGGSLPRRARRILLLLPVARAWRETIGGVSPGGEDYLLLTPARHGTDGFFVAAFRAPFSRIWRNVARCPIAS